MSPWAPLGCDSFRHCLFLMVWTLERTPAQVFCRKSLRVVSLWLWVWGRETPKVKRLSHHVTSGVRTLDVT